MLRLRQKKYYPSLDGMTRITLNREVPMLPLTWEPLPHGECPRRVSMKWSLPQERNSPPFSADFEGRRKGGTTTPPLVVIGHWSKVMQNRLTNTHKGV